MCVWRSVLIRIFLFSLGWWVLAEGDLKEPWLISVGVGAAVVFSMFLFPPVFHGWRIRKVLAFIPWFIWNSILGGIDVARRSLSKDMRLEPKVVKIQLHHGEIPSLLLAWVVSLLPGTACVQWRGSGMSIHILDEKSDPLPKVQELERKLSEMVDESA